MDRTTTLMSRAIIMLVLIKTATGTCFYPNGTAINSPDYAPCSNDENNPLAYVCCAKWDTCLPNGLCKSNFDGDYWRESCTKRNWAAGKCQDMCSNDRESQRNDNAKVTPCDGTSTSLTWCCGKNTTDCCQGDTLVKRYTLAARFGDPIPTIAPSSSSSIATSATATGTETPVSSTSSTLPSSTPTGPIQEANESRLTTGAKAGIGLGAAVGLISILALILFVLKALNWRKKAATAHTLPYSTPSPAVQDTKHTWAHQAEPAQLSGSEDAAVHEMPAAKETSEVAGYVTVPKLNEQHWPK